MTDTPLFINICDSRLVALRLTVNGIVIIVIIVRRQ